MPLLEIENLSVDFTTRKGIARAVDGVSLSLKSGETLCVVGESGSGKSVLAMSVLGLLEKEGKITGGEIRFDTGKEIVDLVKLNEKYMRKIRGNRISMVFQEPMTALNPVLSVGKQLSEPFIIHQKMSKKHALQSAREMLGEVRIPNPERVIKQYPHQLSGGMRQRVMIAMALACRPSVLIADEPTTALDVTIQAQILRLMKELQKEKGTAVLFITHDLGVVSEIADTVAVVYAGEVVEYADKKGIFSSRSILHPYTQALKNSLPERAKKGAVLESIEGSVPSPLETIVGCKFAPRCKYRTEKCFNNRPPLYDLAGGKRVRCFYPSVKERESDKHAKLIVR